MTFDIRKCEASQLHPLKVFNPAFQNLRQWTGR